MYSKIFLNEDFIDFVLEWCEDDCRRGYSNLTDLDDLYDCLNSFIFRRNLDLSDFDIYSFESTINYNVFDELNDIISEADSQCGDGMYQMSGGGFSSWGDYWSYILG